MSLEKDINQRKFQNEYQKASVNLIYTYNWLNEKLKKWFDQYDITLQQFNILRILRGAGGPLSTLEIRQRMLDKMSDTSRIVDRLLAKQLVQKVVCTKDKRLVDVTLLDKGQTLLERIDERMHEVENIFKNLSEPEASSLNSLLDKVRDSH